MKTFKEALTYFMQCVPADSPVDAAIAKIEDMRDRYRELSEEAGSNSTLETAIVAWYEHGTVNGASSALFTAFMAGMVTGIEMEKREENQT